MKVEINRANLQCACAVYQFAFKEANVKIMSELIDACIEQLKTTHSNIVQFVKWETQTYTYITMFDPSQKPALKDLHIRKVSADIDKVTVVLS